MVINPVSKLVNLASNFRVGISAGQIVDPARNFWVDNYVGNFRVINPVSKLVNLASSFWFKNPAK